MTVCTFCIDSIVWGYCEYQSMWDIPLEDGDLPCEPKSGKFTQSTGHGSQEGDWCMVHKLQVIGHVPKKYLPINFFDIQWLYYRCVKIWMVIIWRIFGQSSISPNFDGAKVSLHTVHGVWPLSTYSFKWA